ncbi:MAG: serine protease, partial [Tannerellaceae bacterium]|nr:serine protease [Tannerellaceae bacterium]
MKKIILLIICCLSLPAAAQKAPKWMEKSKKAVITVTTFDKNDRKLQITNGFFIGENGEALSG